jgi:hypothetical protein
LFTVNISGVFGQINAANHITEVAIAT